MKYAYTGGILLDGSEEMEMCIRDSPSPPRLDGSVPAPPGNRGWRTKWLL